mgnify:CR=1 FL=1
MNAEKTGRFIQSLRKEMNMTQKELSEKLNVSPKAVSRWETGRGFPDIGSLEDIAQVLDISVAELLKGERMENHISLQEAEEASRAGLELADVVLKKKTINTAVIGFLCGALIVLVTVIHLFSPVYIKDATQAISLDMLSDHALVAVLKEDVNGYDMEYVTDPDTEKTVCFISCYQTAWSSFRHHRERLIVALDNTEELSAVYYYPSHGENQLLWQNSQAETASDGVVTLPRLIYNMWLLIGVVATLLGTAATMISRKKYYAETVLKLTLLPLSFSLGILLTVWGHFDEVYNAMYYFSGIALMTVLLYGLFLTLLKRRKEKKAGTFSAVHRGFSS